MAEIWKKCTECRNDIEFGANYYQCSVSTCNRTRMPLVFCSVICWDSHLSTVRHRDAGAIEAKAPTKQQWERDQADDHERPTAPSRPNPIPSVMSRPTSAPAVLSRPSPSATSDSVQPVRARSDETRPNLVPPMPAADQQRRVVVATTSAPSPSPASPALSPASSPASSSDGPAMSDAFDKDILIVVSKMKKYIKDRSGFNTSDQIVDVLSDHVRAICDEAIRCAARDDRKTILERDIRPPARR